MLRLALLLLAAVLAASLMRRSKPSALGFLAGISVGVYTADTVFGTILRRFVEFAHMVLISTDV